MIFLAALIGGLIPFLVQLLRRTSADSGAEIRDAVMMILVVGVIPALTIMTGATMIGRDLSERRLSFYFARPIAPVSLWLSKIFGGVITVALVTLLLSLPVLLANGFNWQRAWLTAEVPALWDVAVVLFALLLISHAISTSVRSRSKWVALDFAALLSFGTVLWFAFKRMFFTGAASALMKMTQATVIAVITALLIAGAIQLSRGRAEKVQSHRALSLAAWSLLLGFALVLNLFAIWFVSATPSSLARVKAFGTQPGNDWIWLSGEARNRGHEFRPVFGYQPSTRRALSCPTVCNEILFSADGNTAIALAPEYRYTNPLRIIYKADLSADRPQLKPTNLTMNFYGSTAVSPDGSRLALAGSTVAVYALRGEKLLTSIPLKGSESAEASFIDNDRMLITAMLRGNPSTAHVFLYDLRSHTARDLVNLNVPTSERFMVHVRGDRALGRVLVSSRQNPPATPNGQVTTDVREYDLATGAQTMQRSIVGTNYAIPMHLANGDIALTTYRAADTPELLIINRAGGETRMSLAPLKRAFIAGQRDDGLLVLRNPALDNKRERAALFDLRSGKLVGTQPDLAALNTFTTFFGSDVLDRSQRAHRGNLFVDPTGALVEADLVTGKTTKILGGS
jgi:hypothetical protein